MLTGLAPYESRPLDGKRTFVLVASRYNALYVQGLVDHAAAELRNIMPDADVVHYQVPGSWEIPIVAQELALRTGEGKVDAILALGVIVQGETGHADHLGHSVTEALQQIALRTRVPIIHQVLNVKDEAQARVRCLEDKFNRGTEAARAAVEVVRLLDELKEKAEG